MSHHITASPPRKHTTWEDTHRFLLEAGSEGYIRPATMLDPMQALRFFCCILDCAFSSSQREVAEEHLHAAHHLPPADHQFYLVMCFNGVSRKTKLRICLAQILYAYDHLNEQMPLHARHRSHPHPSMTGHSHAQVHAHAAHQIHGQPQLQFPTSDPYLQLTERKRNLEDHFFGIHLRDLQKHDSHTTHHRSSEEEHQELLRLYAAVMAQAETLGHLRLLQIKDTLDLPDHLTSHEPSRHYICLAQECPCTLLFSGEHQVQAHLQKPSHQHSNDGLTGKYIEISHLQAKCTRFLATGAERMLVDDFEVLLDDVLFFLFLRMPECDMRNALWGRVAHAYDATMPAISNMKAAASFLNARSAHTLPEASCADLRSSFQNAWVGIGTADSPSNIGAIFIPR